MRVAPEAGVEAAEMPEAEVDLLVELEAAVVTASADWLHLRMKLACNLGMDLSLSVMVLSKRLPQPVVQLAHMLQLCLGARASAQRIDQHLRQHLPATFFFKEPVGHSVNKFDIPAV